VREYNRSRLWLYVSIGLIVIVLSGILYYHHIQAPFEQMRVKAIKLARAESTIVKVNRVEFASYENKHLIVFGQDEDNKNIIAWITGNDIYWDYESSGVSVTKIENIVRGLYPNVQFKHIVPNIWRDEYVWEVLYKENNAEEGRSYYRYYRFSDGELLAYYALHK
jgi:uncharacterized protein YpmB